MLHHRRYLYGAILVYAESIASGDLHYKLHQLTSPKTAYSFLDSLLDTSSSLKSSLDEVELYSSYIVKSWTGIVKSSGVL